MILTRTPFRVSFFGGGTDYPAWYEKHGGAVLSCSIDKYCYLSARWRPAFFPEKSRVVWSEIELVNAHAELHHPAVRAALEYLEIERGVEIHHFADLPSRTGLGSSSAFTVGLLAALREMKGESPGPAELAHQAIHVEQRMLKETVGIQDQIQTAHGGLNLVRIAKDGHYSLWPLVLPPGRMEALQSHLMLFYSGISRHASPIAAEQVRAIGAGERDEALRLMADIAVRAADVLQNGRLSEFGDMLNQAWVIKRSLSPNVSNSQVDELYESARRAGATGGKLLGAGGGGFVLVFARPEKQAAIREALQEYLEVPFRIEFSGSRVVYRGQELARERVRDHALDVA